MAHKVVAHFIDHTIVKGTSMDVDPGKRFCHVLTEDQGSVEVDLSQVKALYFVKDFGGRPEYNETGEAKDGDSRLRGSHQARITFQDGEQLSGLMNRYPPNRPYFFVLPMDPASNNVRILVNREAVVEMESLSNGPNQPAAAAPVAPEAKPKPATKRPKKTGWVFDGKGIKYVDAEPRRP
jgi:hypothetical protein